MIYLLRDAVVIRLVIKWCATALPGPTASDTTVAQARGMLHLTAAQLAAKSGRTDDVDLHLAEATDLARHTGERNHLRRHFGPSIVAAWRLVSMVETGRGAQEATRLQTAPIDLDVLGSARRRSAVHFDGHSWQRG